MELSHVDQTNILRLSSSWVDGRDSSFTQLTNDIITRVRQLQSKSDELAALAEKNTQLLTALQQSVERLAKVQGSAAGHREMAEAVLQTVAQVLDRAEEGIDLMQSTVRREYAEGYAEVMQHTSELQREIGLLLGEHPEEALRSPEEIEARAAEFFREAGNSIKSIAGLLQNLVSEQEAYLAGGRRTAREGRSTQPPPQEETPAPPYRRPASQHAPGPTEYASPGGLPPVAAPGAIPRPESAPSPVFQAPAFQETAGHPHFGSPIDREAPAPPPAGATGYPGDQRHRAEPEGENILYQPGPPPPPPAPSVVPAERVAPPTAPGQFGVGLPPAAETWFRPAPVQPAGPAVEDRTLPSPSPAMEPSRAAESVRPATPPEELEPEPATRFTQVVASSFGNLAAMSAFCDAMRHLPGVLEVRATGFSQGVLQLKVEHLEGAVIPSLLMSMNQFETRLIHLSTECVKITVRARGRLGQALRAY